MKTGTNSENPSFGQLGALAGFIIDFLATILNFSQVEYWLSHKTELKKKLREVFSTTDEFSETRLDWQKFYKEKFNWTVDFSTVIIPMMPMVGKWRLLFIPKGMTINLAIKTALRFFLNWRQIKDLDAFVTKNIRNTDSHYAIWVREEVEPDKEFLGKSTSQADPDMKIGITLLERILFEIKYFIETGNHLDINKGLTFCSGSRDVFGDIPHTSLDARGKFYVSSSSLVKAGVTYGIREAVSL